MRDHINRFTCDTCKRVEDEPEQINGWLAVETVVTRATPNFLAEAGIPIDRVKKEHITDRMPFTLAGDYCSLECLVQGAAVAAAERDKYNSETQVGVYKPNPGVYA